MKITIVGAGAIGGWLGVRLASAGHEVSVIARGVTLAALNSAPWRLEIGDTFVETKVRATDNPVALGIQDVVILSVKGPALSKLAPSVTPLIGPETVVVPAMNGVPWWFLLGGGGELPPTSLSSVDPDGAIAGVVPFANVLGCVVHASASVKAPGIVVLKGGNRLILGEPGGDDTTRLKRVCEAFAEAGFEVDRSNAVRREIWYKLWGNMTMNPISAITGATCDRLLDDPLVAGWVVSVMNEAQAIGARIGCHIDERPEDRNAVTRKLGAFKTSMLQDVEAGREVEIDQLLSAPREIAGSLHQPTPNLDALTGMVRLFGRTRGLYPDEIRSDH